MYSSPRDIPSSIVSDSSARPHLVRISHKAKRYCWNIGLVTTVMSIGRSAGQLVSEFSAYSKVTEILGSAWRDFLTTMVLYQLYQY